MKKQKIKIPEAMEGLGFSKTGARYFLVESKKRDKWNVKRLKGI